MNRMSKLVGFACCTLMGGAALAASTQPYPSRPIRIVVGFQAGGGVDISARAIGKELTEALNQSVIVDNRPGASGNIAAELVSKAAPDGYSLLMSNSTIAIPSLFTKLPYDVTKDLQALSLIAIGPSALVVQPSFPVTTVKDVVAMAKAKPKHLIFGSGGPGNITHLEMELLMNMAGIEMIHVPYKGGAPSVVGLLSGEVQMLFTSIPSVLQQVNAGKLKAIGVSTAKRHSSMPNVPTISESGLPGYDAASWYGLFVPAGTPKDVMAVLSREITKTMRVQSVRDRFASDGFDPVGNTPEEFTKFVREEIPKWAKVVKAQNIKGE